MTLSHTELRSLGLTEEGIRFVEETRACPARRVGGTRFNSITHRFPSIKMGVTIQAESRTCELPFARLCELDENVIEYWDQPAISVDRVSSTGRLLLTRITLDYLLIRSDGVFTVECKPRSKLHRLVAKKPMDWTCDEDGVFHQPHVEKALAKLGIQHLVWDSDALTRTHKDNLAILIAAARRAIPGHEQQLLADLQAILSNKPLPISNLCTYWENLSPLTVLGWVAKGHLSALVDQQNITEFKSTLVFHGTFSCDIAKEILRQNQVDAWSSDSSNIVRFTKKQLEKAQQHIAAVDSARMEGRGLTPYLRKLRSRIRRAEREGASRLYAAVPRWDLRGNRKRRYSETQLKWIERSIDLHYLTAKKPSKSAAWRSTNRDLAQHGFKISRRTWCLELKRIKAERVAMNREGHRAAAALRPPSNAREHLDVPWLHAHADSTPIDAKVFRDTLLGEILDRPTLYKLVDQATGFVLALVLHFGAPSRDFVALLLRDCVRRWGRLPLRISFDGGKEYNSTYTEQTLAWLMIEKAERPLGAAKYGGRVESSFGRLDVLVTHTIHGNTQNDRSRATTNEVRAHRHALHELTSLRALIEDAVFNGLNHKPFEHRVFSPHEAFFEGATLFQDLAQERSYDTAFFIDTSIELPSPITLNYSDGIVYKHRRYSAEKLADPCLDRSKVIVRREPFCPSVLYVGIGNRWVIAKSADHDVLMGLSEEERWAHYVLFDQIGRAAGARSEAGAMNVCEIVHKHEHAAVLARQGKQKTARVTRRTGLDSVAAAFKKAISTKLEERP